MSGLTNDVAADVSVLGTVFLVYHVLFKPHYHLNALEIENLCNVLVSASHFVSRRVEKRSQERLLESQMIPWKCDQSIYRASDYAIMSYWRQRKMS